MGPHGLLGWTAVTGNMFFVPFTPSSPDSLSGLPLRSTASVSLVVERPLVVAPSNLQLPLVQRNVPVRRVPPANQHELI